MPESLNPEENSSSSNQLDYAGLLQEAQAQPEDSGPISETETTISYLGVELQKGTGNEAFVPRRNERFISDEFALGLQRDLATGFKLHQPVLLEGGTSLGKTTTCQKMCAELGWSWHYSNNTGSSEVETMMGSYLPNPNRTSVTDPEFVFIDGPVTAAIREASEGNKVMLVVDELNATQPNILIRLHEVLDAYEKGQIITLSEDANEKLQVARDNLHVVGLTNPPSRSGSQYLGREALDPAQIRRWVYRKLPDELPHDSMQYATKALFGLESETAEVYEAAHSPSAPERIPRSELAHIPGLPEIVDLYTEFHQQAKALVKERKIGDDQPQRFSYDDREEPRRVMEYIQDFYRGDINATFQEALRYFYSGKLAGDGDRDMMRELIGTVYVEPKTDSRRRRATEVRYDESTSEAWRPTEEQEQQALDFIRNVTRLTGDPLSTGKPAILTSVAGLRIAEVEDFRTKFEQVSRQRTPDNLGQLAAGDTSGEAANFRKRLRRHGRYKAAAESLTGTTPIIGVRELNDTYLEALALTDKQEVVNALAVALAGNDSDEAWGTRNFFLTKGATHKSIILGTTGLDSDKAWEARLSRRNDNDPFSRTNADVLGQSIMGLSGGQAQKVRDELRIRGRSGALAYSLGGLDNTAAWKLREEMEMNGVSPTELIVSLGGLYTERAQAERQRLLDKGAKPLAAIVSINGSWVMAGVKRAQRESDSR